MKKTIDIGWCDTNHETSLIYYEPEPLYESVYKDVTTAFKVCPAVRDYLRNFYILRSPIDLNFVLKKESDTECLIGYDSKADQEKGKNWIVFEDRKREWSPKHADESTSRLKMKPGNPPLISFSFHYLFISDIPNVYVEEMPPYLHMHNLTWCKNMRFVPGSFDIGSWYRAIDIACEYTGEYDAITIKRGDPMCYVRFRAPNDEKANLVRIAANDEIKRLIDTATMTKEYVTGLSLKELYRRFIKIKRKTSYIERLRLDR